MAKKNSPMSAGTIYMDLAVGNTSRLKSAVKSAGDSGGASAGTTFANSFISTVKNGFAIGVGMKLFEGLTKAVKSTWDYFTTGAKEAYDVQFEAETRLEQVMKNTMNATKDQIQATKDWASALQQVGVIGDEVTLSGLQELGTYIENPESLKKMSVVLDDMLVQQYGLNATAENAVSIATMLGKVLEGQTSALSRYGYSFDEAQEQLLKYGNEQQRVATLAEVVEASVGGMNEAFANTTAGRLKQVENSLGDIKERFGEIGNNLKTLFLPLAERFVKIMDYIADKLLWITNQLKLYLETLGIDFGKDINVSGVGDAIRSVMDESIDYTLDLVDDAIESTQKKIEGLAAFDQINKLTGSSSEDEEEASASAGGVSNFGEGAGYNINNIMNQAEETETKLNGTVKKFLDKIKNIGVKIWGFLKDLGAKFWKWFSPYFDRLKTAFKGMGEQVKEWFNEQDFKGKFERIGQMASRLADHFMECFVSFIEQYGPIFLDAFLKITGMISDFIDDHLPDIERILKKIIDLVFKIGAAIGDWWSENGDEFLQNMRGVLEVIWNIVSNIIEHVIDFISDWGPILVQSALDFINGIAGFLSKWGPYITETIDVVLDGIRLAADVIAFIIGALLSGLPDILNAICTTIGLMIATIVELIGVTVGVIYDLIYGLFEAIYLIITGLIDVVKKVFSAISSVLSSAWDTWYNFWEGVGGTAYDVVQKILGFFKNAWEKIKNAFSNVKDFIKNFFEGLLDVIKTPINWIISAINTVINALNKLHVDVPDWVPGIGGSTFGFSIPTIPQLAEGGIAEPKQGGQLVNVAEAGQAEAIIPLDKFWSKLDETNITITNCFEALMALLKMKADKAVNVEMPKMPEMPQPINQINMPQMPQVINQVEMPTIATPQIITQPELPLTNATPAIAPALDMAGLKEDIARIVAETMATMAIGNNNDTNNDGTPVHLEINVAGRNFFDDTIKEINRRSRNNGKCVINV